MTSIIRSGYNESTRNGITETFNDNDEADNDSLQCGVCKQAFETGTLKSSLKFGITSCEPCRNFICRMLRTTSNSIKSFSILTCKSQTVGNCELPPTTIKTGRKMIVNQTNLRCKACWLSCCIKNYNLPLHQKQQLVSILPEGIRKSCAIFYGKSTAPVNDNNILEAKLRGVSFNSRKSKENTSLINANGNDVPYEITEIDYKDEENSCFDNNNDINYKQENHKNGRINVNALIKNDKCRSFRRSNKMPKLMKRFNFSQLKSLKRLTNKSIFQIRKQLLLQKQDRNKIFNDRLKSKRFESGLYNRSKLVRNGVIAKINGNEKKKSSSVERMINYNRHKDINGDVTAFLKNKDDKFQPNINEEKIDCNTLMQRRNEKIHFNKSKISKARDLGSYNEKILQLKNKDNTSKYNGKRKSIDVNVLRYKNDTNCKSVLNVPELITIKKQAINDSTENEEVEGSCSKRISNDNSSKCDKLAVITTGKEERISPLPSSESDTFHGFNISDDNASDSETWRRKKSRFRETASGNNPEINCTNLKKSKEEEFLKNTQNEEKSNDISDVRATSSNIGGFHSDNETASNGTVKAEEVDEINDDITNVEFVDRRKKLRSKLSLKRTTSIIRTNEISLSRKNNVLYSRKEKMSSTVSHAVNLNNDINDEIDLRTRVKSRKRKPNLHYSDGHANDANKTRRKAAINFMERMKLYAVSSLLDYKDNECRDNEYVPESNNPQEKDVSVNTVGEISNNLPPCCSICGANRGQLIKKYSVPTCRACYSFIMRIFLIPSRECTDAGYFTCNLYHGTLGKCGVEIPLKYQNMTYGYPTRRRCKACWIAMFISKCKMPFDKKRELAMLIPKRMRESALKNVPKEELEEPLNRIVTTIENINAGRIRNYKNTIIIIKHSSPWASEIIKKIMDRKKVQRSHQL